MRVAVERAPGVARVWVRDSGPGIAPKDQAHLFDRYWTWRQGNGCGTGLGLYIAHGIVEAHGGRLYAESDPGRATFTVELPA